MSCATPTLSRAKQNAKEIEETACYVYFVILSIKSQPSSEAQTRTSYFTNSPNRRYTWSFRHEHVQSCCNYLPRGDTSHTHDWTNQFYSPRYLHHTFALREEWRHSKGRRSMTNLPFTIDKAIAQSTNGLGEATLTVQSHKIRRESKTKASINIKPVSSPRNRIRWWCPWTLPAPACWSTAASSSFGRFSVNIFFQPADETRNKPKGIHGAVHIAYEHITGRVRGGDRVEWVSRFIEEFLWTIQESLYQSLTSNCPGGRICLSPRLKKRHKSTWSRLDSPGSAWFIWKITTKSWYCV